MDNYLGYEICAVWKDWLIVYDGSLNYMVFPFDRWSIVYRYINGWLPRNRSAQYYIKSEGRQGSLKQVEFFSNFDNALEMGLINNIRNGGKFD